MNQLAIIHGRARPSFVRIVPVILVLLFDCSSDYCTDSRPHHRRHSWLCQAYSSAIVVGSATTTTRRPRYSATNRNRRVLQLQMEHGHHRFYRISHARESSHYSSLRMVHLRTATTISTSEPTAKTERFSTVAIKESGGECDCCLEHPDASYPQDRTTTTTNDSVIRNVHSSTIDPAMWQQYMVPTLSWWDTLVPAIRRIHENNDNTATNPYCGTDISLRWNFTLDDATIMATAERFMDLFDATATTTTGSTAKSSLPWPSPIWSSHSSTPQPQPHRDAMIQNIASAMIAFSTFCDQHYHHPRDGRHSDRPVLSFTMRLLCTYGGNGAGTKCPIWHIDHVPCRYIQTLYGPTCRFIDHPRDNRIIYQRIMRAQQQNSADTGFDDTEFRSVDERNALLLQGIDAPRGIGHANVGEGMILLGNEWSQWTTTSATSDDDHHHQDATNMSDPRRRTITAAVHQSPPIISPQQGRILFTINVYDIE